MYSETQLTVVALVVPPIVTFRLYTFPVVLVPRLALVILGILAELLAICLPPVDAVIEQLPLDHDPTEMDPSGIVTLVELMVMFAPMIALTVIDPLDQLPFVILTLYVFVELLVALEIVCAVVSYVSPAAVCPLLYAE